MENPFKNAPSFIKFILETFKETGKNKQHWLKKGVLATTQASGAPCLRTVVIRAVNELLNLEIHTDSRSKKVVDILSKPLAEILFYDPISEIQLKFSGPVKLLQTGLEVNEAWKKIPEESKKQYSTLLAPGTVISANESISYSEKSHFCIFSIQTNCVEYLKLGNPPQRFRMLQKNGTFILESLVP